MTTTEIAVRPAQQSVVLSNEQLQYISRTEFVPAGLRGNLPAILACVASGRALGIADMTALRMINIIDGRPSYSAELMVQLVRKHGHSIVGNFGPDTVTAEGTRIDNGDEINVTWTIEMAERAGLTSKPNWKKYPEAMLWARAVSQLCRMLFADCFAGGTYTPEEIGEGAIFDDDTEDSAGEPEAADATGPAASTVDVPEDSLTASASPVSADRTSSPVEAASAAQKKKLNVLVGTMREAGKLSTEHLYLALATDRRCFGVDDLARLVEGRDAEGVLHWAPLRESLSKDEASALIERLTVLEQKVAV